MTYVAGRGTSGEAYFLARVPVAGAIVMHAGSEAEESEAELWFIYSAGRVVAFARYEAV
jgi:hypothetical protein